MNLPELKILAKYPFLKEAKEYVNSLNLNLEEIQNHPLYSVSLDLGRERVIKAIKNSLELDLQDKISCEFSILSYALARILVNLTKNKNLIERYAQGEASQAYQFLKNEDDEIKKKVMEETNFFPQGDEIPFPLYLTLSKNLSKKNPQQWKLIQRDLNNGLVKISEEEKLLLLREAIKEKISQPLPSTKGLPKNFFKLANNLNSFLLGTKREMKVKEIKEELLPPCISSLLRSLESGDISHQGMFILATFFINLGLKKEKIIAIFSKFPNFSQEKTSYQIEFLSGEKSETKYSCPNCQKIKFYGLCPLNCGVKHPIRYYYKRRGRR